MRIVIEFSEFDASYEVRELSITQTHTENAHACHY